jgi:KDO2-lipid IV(A) lauroyltransferase
MERLRPERLFTLVRRQREAAGIHMEPMEPHAIGVLTHALRDGAVVALLADRDIGGAGEPVEFFGAEARLPSGPALLALRTGAPLLAAFGRRLPDNRLYVSIQPPIYLQRTRDLRADRREGLRVMAGLLEEGIAKTPDQWLVFKPIWQGGAA